jgi:hypothetical protein
MKTHLSRCHCDKLLFFRAAGVKEHSLQLLVSSSRFCSYLKLKVLIRTLLQSHVIISAKVKLIMVLLICSYKELLRYLIKRSKNCDNDFFWQVHNQVLKKVLITDNFLKLKTNLIIFKFCYYASRGSHARASIFYSTHKNATGKKHSWRISLTTRAPGLAAMFFIRCDGPTQK